MVPSVVTCIGGYEDLRRRLATAASTVAVASSTAR